jgi:membrane-associated phospholipid phosphatase
MLGPIESGIGLDVVVWLQAHGNALFDLLAHVLDFAGGSMFALIVGPLFYWLIDKRLGQHILFLLLLGGLVMAITKEIAQTPRPYIAHPEQVIPLFTEEGYGLPSGHVINAITFWLPVVLWHKSRRAWWLFGGYVLLIMWSRMYAGVHYPQDVLGGLLIGLAVGWVYLRAPVDEMVHSPVVQGIVLQPLILVPLLSHYQDGVTVSGALCGLGIGLWLEQRFVDFTTTDDLRQRAIRYGVGIVTMMVVFVVLRLLFGSAEPEALFRCLRYAAVSLYALAIWPWAWQRAGV